MKDIVTNWPNQRFMHVWDQMYTSPSQLFPSVLVATTNSSGTDFWQGGTKSASFTLEQPQAPWLSCVFFSGIKGAGPLAAGHRLWSVTVWHSFSAPSAAIQSMPWEEWPCKLSIWSSSHAAVMTECCDSYPTQASSNLLFPRSLLKLI